MRIIQILIKSTACK